MKDAKKHFRTSTPYHPMGKSDHALLCNCPKCNDPFELFADEEEWENLNRRYTQAVRMPKSSQYIPSAWQTDLDDELEFEDEAYFLGKLWDYLSGPPKPAASSIIPRINRKSRAYIRWLQNALNRVMGSKLMVDGIIGNNTRRVIRDFQRRFSLTVDGIVGSQTEAKLAMLGFKVPDSTRIPVLPATGSWLLPPAVQAAGEAQYIRYDRPPPWSADRSSCSENFTAGARQLKEYILSVYPGVSRIGGYNCRVNSANRSQTSVHGVGRALDIMIPIVSNRANSAVGDPIANWLVKNAQAFGIQYIIWNRTKWNGSYSGRKHGRYGGPSPHIDHLHVELNRDGANRATPGFRNGLLTANK